ncbi:MAG: hypothetical protein C0407_14095, partial [Desulfobacca sp.]|nr:hypothetical protein [Desulfobacca sp.]
MGDDFAQYIQHASNIHQGLPYSNLPYPFNPLSQIGPPAYPPVYPLLISPFTGGAVPQFIWMKAMSVFLFGIALLVLYKIFQAINDTALAPETLLIFPFLPWIFLDAGYLGSDTPYACFSFISLWSLTALPEDRPGWIPPIITGLLIALSTLTRDTGIALWAGSLLYLSQKIWKNQRARSIYLVQILLISTAFLLPLISWKIYEDHLGLSPANMIYLKTALGWDHFTIYGFFIRLVSNFYYYLTKCYELLFPLSFLIPPIPYLNWLRFPITLLILAMIAW